MIQTGRSDSGYDVESYFQFVEHGILDADDHVELLEGVIVASPPLSPRHASVLMFSRRRGPGRHWQSRVHPAAVCADRRPASAPEPDLAVVPGHHADYCDHHPTTALLVVEISDISLPLDRLSKSRIYASAAVREYWIVNLRDRRVEVHTRPDRERRIYGNVRNVTRGEAIELAAFPGTHVAVSDFLPGY